MRIIEAVTHRMPWTEKPVVSSWTLEQTVDKLTQLDTSQVNNLKVLRKINPGHVHGFQSLRRGPESLHNEADRLLATSKDDGSFLGSNGWEIINLFSEHFNSIGLSNISPGASGPEKGIEYSSPYHIVITPDYQGKKWDPKKTIRLFDWIDYSVDLTSRYALQLNTTRVKENDYMVNIPHLDEFKEEMENPEKLVVAQRSFHLKLKHQRLISLMLDARV